MVWWFAQPECLNEEAMSTTGYAYAHIADENNEL